MRRLKRRQLLLLNLLLRHRHRMKTNMKTNIKLITVLLSVVYIICLCVIARGKEVKFSWDAYEGTNGLSSNMVYRLYGTTNMPPSKEFPLVSNGWSVLGIVTNATIVEVDIGDGEGVLVCAVTVSNLLFESSFTNALPLPIKPLWRGDTNQSLRYQISPK